MSKIFSKESSYVDDRVQAVRERIDAACARAGRDPGEVRLVAVSKNHPPEAIGAARGAGVRRFGENRVQEARSKQPLTPSDIEWHLVGHLQRNKVRHAVGIFEWIHSVDSLDLARTLNRVAAEEGLSPHVLIQVNVAGEASKFGFRPEPLREAMEEMLALDRLNIEGLMTIAPYSRDPEDSRGHFVALRALRDTLAGEFAAGLPDLSMGMTGDFETAIEEGATLVRIGTAIFGERPR